MKPRAKQRSNRKGRFMEDKTLLSLLTDLAAYIAKDNVRGKGILEEPNRFKSLFLDFSQGQYKAEANVFGAFLGSVHAQKVKDSKGDAANLRAVARYFHEDTLIDKGVCEMVVTASAWLMGLIGKEAFEAGPDRGAAEAPPAPAKASPPQPPAKAPPSETPEPAKAGTGAKTPETKPTPTPAKAGTGAKTPETKPAPPPAKAPPPPKADAPVPEGLEFEIVEGKSVTITRYSGLADEVAIPERIKGLPVTDIGKGAFNGCRTLTSVTIPSSVTTIGGDAFRGCDRLTSITIPSSVRYIKDCAFYRCTRLTSVTIPSSVITIGDYAFTECKSLKSISLSRLTQLGDEVFPLFKRKTYIDFMAYCTSCGKPLKEGLKFCSSCGAAVPNR